MKTFYAAILQNAYDEIKDYYPFMLEHLKPDTVLVVDGGSTDGTIEFLNGLGVTVIQHPFEDFVTQRNLYMRALDSMANDGDILLVSDADEYFSLDLLRDVRQFVEPAYEADCNLIRVRVKDEWVDREGRIISSEFNNWYKPLITLLEPGGEYLGSKLRPIHEELHYPSNRRFFTLNDAGGKYYYVHRRKYGIIWPHALRNFYIGGVGPDGIEPPYWQEFRSLLGRHGMRSWGDVEKRFEIGGIDEEIQRWLIAHRDEPYCEVRDSFLAYFVWWHPEEMPDTLRPKYKDEIEKTHG